MIRARRQHLLAVKHRFPDRPRRLGHAHKKQLRASEQQRPDVKQKRTIWRRAQSRLDITKLIFLNETGSCRLNCFPQVAMAFIQQFGLRKLLSIHQVARLAVR